MVATWSGIILRAFLRRNSHCLCKCFEIIAVIVESACFASLVDRVPLTEQGLGQGDAFGGDVFVDGCSGRGFEDTADVRTAQIKM